MNKYKDQALAIVAQWRDMQYGSSCSEQDRVEFLSFVAGDSDLAVIEELLNLCISSKEPVWGSKENTDTSGIRDFDHEGEGYKA